jgi:hypothetical protein
VNRPLAANHGGVSLSDHKEKVRPLWQGTGLTPATPYFFRFRGVTKAGEGDWSQVVIVKGEAPAGRVGVDSSRGGVFSRTVGVSTSREGASISPRGFIP